MRKRNFTDLNCKSTVYITPDTILDPVRSYFGGQIPLDPATEPCNPTRASKFCTKETSDVFEMGPPHNWEHDGLRLSWSRHSGVFVNPPYGKQIKFWCEKICREATYGVPIIALLPAGARFSTKYFQSYILGPHLDAVCFVRGRVKFLRPDGSGTAGQNPYDSMLMGFSVDANKFAACFKHLGKIVRTRIDE